MRSGRRLLRDGRWILGALAASGLTSADVANAEPVTTEVTTEVTTPEPEVATAGALYRYETADGTVAFTDDAKRIPERYREGATTIEPSVLDGYGRYTPADKAASETSAERLEARLAKLRAANAPVADEAEEAVAPAAVASAPPVRRDIKRRRAFKDANGKTYYRYYRDWTTVENGGSLPVDPSDPNPVVTEKRRVKVPGQPITQTVTVVRQGDRVLSTQAPRSHYHSLDFDELSDFEVGSVVEE